MASSIANWLENEVMNAVFKATAMEFTGPGDVPAGIWVQLHDDGGEPGEDGTANIATETTRQEVTSFGSVTDGAVSSAADVVWTNVAATETYHSVSLWDDETVGNCLWVGNLSVDKSVTAGDTFTIPSGSLTITLG